MVKLQFAIKPGEQLLPVDRRDTAALRTVADTVADHGGAGHTGAGTSINPGRDRAYTIGTFNPKNGHFAMETRAFCHGKGCILPWKRVHLASRERVHLASRERVHLASRKRVHLAFGIQEKSAFGIQEKSAFGI